MIIGWSKVIANAKVSGMGSDVSGSSLSGYKRDYYGGALMILIGLGAVVQGRTYETGTLTQMRPGFFPVALGAILVLIGVAIAGTARRPPLLSSIEKGIELQDSRSDWRGWLCILLSIVAFVVLGRWGGLMPAAFAITFISALGDRDNSFRAAFALAALITLLCILIFWWALKLQFPLFTWG